MPVKKRLHGIALTHPDRLQTLVENRRIFNLKHCELNVFESYEQAYQVPLTFQDFVITSMVRGKKVMHLPGREAFDYLPGESVIAPPGETMIIDFPLADTAAPTQCVALTVDAAYIHDTLDYLDEYYNSVPDEPAKWKLEFSQYHFDNDDNVAALMDRLIGICSSGDTAKNIYADLNLKELLIRIMQSQQLDQLDHVKGQRSNDSRIHFVLQYIHAHLTEKIPVDLLSRKAYLSRNLFFKWFKEQLGITPLDYINRERLKFAKQLLSEGRLPLADVSLQCGFNDVNYFIRLFRKTEGITPGAYQALCRVSGNI